MSVPSIAPTPARGVNVCRHCGAPMQTVAGHVGGQGLVERSVCSAAWNHPVYRNAYPCGAARPALQESAA